MTVVDMNRGDCPGAPWHAPVIEIDSVIEQGALSRFGYELNEIAIQDLDASSPRRYNDDTYRLSRGTADESLLRTYAQCLLRGGYRYVDCVHCPWQDG
ncbi:MAG: hypothetical protein P4L33_01675 [Capsulimonadaceae bacterium]|nr:hypothetical protein [Capsulimonadaceae bacterium]